jgi:hypothetical protein
MNMSVTPSIYAAPAVALAFGLLLGACTTDQKPATQQPTVRLSYERLSPTVASEARSWSVEETKRQISDMTYLKNVPGQRNEVFYFSPDNVVYSWATGKKFIETATWTVDMRKSLGSDTAAVFICMSFPQIDSSGAAIVGTPTTRCLDPAILYTPAVDRVRGDAFGIRGRKPAPFALPVERTTIASLKR